MEEVGECWEVGEGVCGEHSGRSGPRQVQLFLLVHHGWGIGLGWGGGGGVREGEGEGEVGWGEWGGVGV